MKTLEALLPPQSRTVPQMLRRQAAQFGDRPAATFGQRCWTHREVGDIAARRAGALREAGVGRGERVAIMSANRAECLETFLACGWSGAVAVPINTASRGPQVEYFLANSQARLLVIEAQYLERLEMVD